MRAELIQIIEGIRRDPGIYSLDEAGVKQGVILRIISHLGWDTFNVREVVPEHQIGDGRVDYSLNLSGESRVYVEAKRPKADLHEHQGQLLRYAFEGGVKLAILSNGLTWWFYLPLLEGDWEQRRFYAVHISEQDAGHVTDRLIEFLSRDRVADSSAYQAAERLCTDKRRTQIVSQTLPKAWNRLVEEGDELLVDLLREATEEMCGFKADEGEVQDFLIQNLGSLALSTAQAEETRKPVEPASKVKSKPRVAETNRAGTDNGFLRDLRQLPIELQRVGEQLLSRVRSLYPQGGLEYSKTGRYVERPENFWTVKIQPRVGSYALTVYGTPMQFSQTKSIEIKKDRGSYSRFNVWSESQLDDAIVVISRAMAMKE